MDSLWRKLGKAPNRVDTDDIYPVHMLDGTKTLRGITVNWILRFDAILDGNKLHGALSRLLDMGDWRKMGGRLRLNEKGVLEIHVPRPFTSDRPAVAYSCEKLNVDIENHELARTLPQATDKLSIQPGPDNFQSFAIRADAPKAFNDFIYHDVPLLSLHVTTFNDATLVGLSWPHVLMDVMGQQALLRAWSLVLSDRDVDVPPVLGAREDALCTAADASGEAEEFEIGKQRLKGTGLLSFGLRFAWDLIRGPAMEARTVYMPATVLAALRREAEADLATSGEVPFISDNDLLTAWGVRMVALSQRQPRPVTVLHALNARFRLPELAQAPGVFIQNMAVAGFTLLSAAKATGSLGSVALANRQHLRAQATKGQIVAFVRDLQQEAAGADPRLLCGPSDALLMPVTNWERADIFGSADFSAAVVRSGPSSSPGRIVCHLPSSIGAGEPRNLLVVLGKDNEGGYWLTAHLSPAAWANMANMPTTK
ncbi:hypothetical protein B0I35DRAFT_365900 [Stachybotrys elegans]|uniref:Uncharacterized protein n=1 Tax=Stachybotrys elegans TaxID=80388 RepID=A0A8K0SFI6_9HYPO|nr:hypothetical protein B0I35DRAFT_365900 [Stachybotrys elegans]